AARPHGSVSTSGVPAARVSDPRGMLARVGEKPKDLLQFRAMVMPETELKKVLVSDPVAPECLDVLKAAPGFAHDYRPGMKVPELLEVIPAYAGLIVRSETKVTAEVLD